MARTPFNLNSYEKYESKIDQDPKTVWNLGPIDSSLMAALDDELLGYQTSNGKLGVEAKNAPPQEQWLVVRMNRRYVELVRFGLKGWENYVTSEGKEVPFLTQEYVVNRVGSRTGVAESLIQAMPLDVIIELGERILELNKLPGDHRKN